ncbi:MAG: polyphenol oxidase family protein [Endomicrobiia bacterium]
MLNIKPRHLKNKIVFNISKKFNIFITTKNVFCNKINLPEILKKLNISKKFNIIICEQVHGKKIKFLLKPKTITSCGYKICFNKNVDGIVTNNTKNLVCIFTADCVPLFLFNEKRNIFGIVHIGRKGVLDGIVENLILKIKKFSLKNFKFVLGPHICEKCYKINKNLAKNAKYGFNKTTNFFSLKKEIIGRLLKSGICIEQIGVSNYCTYHHNTKFYSYRRGDKEKRLVSLIYKK